MAKIIRLTERDLTRLVKRVIKEQTLPTDFSKSFDMVSQMTDNLGRMVSNQAEKLVGGSDLPECASVMKGDGRPGSPTSAEGPFDKISANFSVSPQYQGYTLFKGGKPFCFIKK